MKINSTPKSSLFPDRPKVICFLLMLVLCLSGIVSGQPVQKTMLRIPDTGETNSYTNTFGEDHDYNIHPPFFILHGNGTVTDTVTSLMWQAKDGGEMTIENAMLYCDTLSLGAHSDWRLPNAHEGFSILNLQKSNPALDGNVFVNTGAEYWWTRDRQANDVNKVWATNAGGGIGNHPKTETISAGQATSTKKFHVRAVRDVAVPTIIPQHFTDNGDGSITDHLTGLTWQKVLNGNPMSWEDALNYAESLSLAGRTDWRLPNIRELQSLNDESKINPSVNTSVFPFIGIKKYWSSTTLPNQITKAWFWQTQFGITTYDLKTAQNSVICVRSDNGTITGIGNKHRKALGLSVFPNPALSQFTIRFATDVISTDCDVVLRNATGQIVYAPSFWENPQDITIQTRNLAEGFYFVSVLNDKQIRTLGVTIKKQ
jgi:hypothetical protein